MHVSPLLSDPSFQIAYRHFQSIVVQIDDKKTYEKALRQANKKYDIKNFKVLNMTPVKARKIYPTIVEKYRQHLDQEESWLQNERRLFIWLVICFIFVSQKNILELTSADFDIFTSIFNQKKEDFLKFQLFALIKKPKNEIKWTFEEDNILRRALNLNKFQQEEIEWNEVSKQFFQLSNQKFYRSSKQCRQRWMNHLDPNKIKGTWTSEQDLVLLKSVKEKGKKWSQISKELEGCKTQHMVKNRYNSLMNRKSKDMGKKSEEKIINKLIEELQPNNENKIQEEEFKTSSKQGNSFLDNRSDRIKSEKNDEFPNIFESDSIQSNGGNNGNPGRKYKFFIRKAGSLSMSERGGMLPDLTNPILEQMDSEEDRFRQKILISTPVSDRGEMKSPSMFFLEGDMKVTKEIYNSDFSLSCISNFDKFVPE